MGEYETLRPEGYLPRLADGLVRSALEEFGGVEVCGPRWCGKSWTSMAHGASITRVDEHASLYEDDPALALIGARPHVVDEWHDVPAGSRYAPRTSLSRVFPSRRALASIADASDGSRRTVKLAKSDLTQRYGSSPRESHSSTIASISAWVISLLWSAMTASLPIPRVSSCSLARSSRVLIATHARSEPACCHRVHQSRGRNAAMTVICVIVYGRPRRVQHKR